MNERERAREAVIVAAESYCADPGGMNFARLRKAVEANWRVCGVPMPTAPAAPEAATGETDCRQCIYRSPEPVAGAWCFKFATRQDNCPKFTPDPAPASEAGKCLRCGGLGTVDDGLPNIAGLCEQVPCPACAPARGAKGGGE